MHVMISLEVETPVSLAIEQARNRLAAAMELTRDETRISARIVPNRFERQESFDICHKSGTVCVLGSDATGLAYGLEELSAQIELGCGPVVARVQPCRKKPLCRVRSVAMFLHNEDVEREMFFSCEFWDAYFSGMVRSRLNTFNLIFGHQTSYMSPLFPFFVEVPGFEHARVIGLSNPERRKNLDGLRMIASRAEAWGIFFSIGIWQQHAHEFGKNMVEGLVYEDLFTYCPRALAVLLSECPGIRGIQFRMNEESGVKDEDQAEFFECMLKAILSCGRNIRIDLRAKGLRAETIERTALLTSRFMVSTKFWCEHMGLPYFATEVIPEDRNIPIRYRRYGFWDLLRNDRKYEVLFRLWTAGTQRILTWGDPSYGAKFATSTVFGRDTWKEGDELEEYSGFEIMAPLSHKGYGNHAGGPWRILKNREDEAFAWEIQRYWAFFMTFGLTGYEPANEPVLYHAEFLRRFGSGGADAEASLRAASRALPLITAAHAPSASVMAYWVEMDTGGLSDCYARCVTGDPGRFDSVTDFVETWAAGEESPKISPLEVAKRLDACAEEAELKLEAARTKIGDEKRGELEFKGLAIDIGIQIALARYHAARLRSAVNYTSFSYSLDADSLHEAVLEFSKAVDEWRKLSENAERFYYSNLVFNRPASQIGHWKDELPFLEDELKRLSTIEGLWREKGRAAAGESQWVEREMDWKAESGVLSRWAGAIKQAKPLPNYTYESTARRYAVRTPEAFIGDAVRSAVGRGAVPSDERTADFTVSHEPEIATIPGRDLVIHCLASGVAEMRLHYRHLLQIESWQILEMESNDGKTFHGCIPGAFIGPDWEVMYAFEIRDGHGRKRFWPDLFEGQPYFVVKTVPSLKGV